MAASSKLRVFFIPFYATGHMIPFLNLASLFAARPDVEPTLVTTAANVALLRPIIDRFASSGCHVDLLLFPFPSAEAGLLPGQENISSIPYADIYKMCMASDASKDVIKRLLHLHRPDAVVTDVAFWWMSSVTLELKIPNIIFHIIGAFPQRIMDALHRGRTYELEDNFDAITVADLPGKEIRIPRSELPWFLRTHTHLTDSWVKMKEAQMESFGVVVNTFYELEPEYCEEYRRTVCQKAWFVGPVGLAAEAGSEGVAAAADDNSLCLRWLDGKREGSVVYVCFGSWCNFTDAQLKEIALGLEESQQNFLWVVRGCKDGELTGEEWVPDGWEQRVEGRGILVRGWAPQTAILGHKAVGAFMTQCGWNSVLEALTAGVALLTWPLVFEQFMNERLVVEVAGAGARVWDGLRSTRDEERVVVPKEVIGRAVYGFMNGDGRAAARARARELKASVQGAVAEGGSSWIDLNCLIDEIMREKRTEDTR